MKGLAYKTLARQTYFHGQSTPQQADYFLLLLLIIHGYDKKSVIKKIQNAFEDEQNSYNKTFPKSILNIYFLAFFTIAAGNLFGLKRAFLLSRMTIFNY